MEGLMTQTVTTEAPPQVEPERSIWDIVFDMEDRLRAARDYVGLLNERLAEINRPISKKEQGRLSRLAGDVFAAMDETVDQYDELFDRAQKDRAS
jgi:hypothetical protein